MSDLCGECWVCGTLLVICPSSGPLEMLVLLRAPPPFTQVRHEFTCIIPGLEIHVVANTLAISGQTIVMSGQN